MSYQSGTRSLLVTPAGLSAAAGRAYQLWLIPPSGTPRSLGLVDAAGPQRVPVTPPLLGAFDGNATLAVSVEPAGGSPVGGIGGVSASTPGANRGRPEGI